MFTSIVGLAALLMFMGWMLPVTGISRRYTRFAIFGIALVLFFAGPIFYEIWNLKSANMGFLNFVMFCSPLGVYVISTELFYPPDELLLLSNTSNAIFYLILMGIGILYYSKSRRRRQDLRGYYEIDEDALAPPAPYVLGVKRNS
jgi:hypothetical protein